ncbi:MAG: hypothetical protein H0W08_06320 [Acidobacteria bacterium]|nr:hypothetical protein [Acidobacteriota bacterium]
MPRKPTSAGIDPYHLPIDLQVDNNIKKVKIQSGGRTEVGRMQRETATAYAV